MSDILALNSMTTIFFAGLSIALIFWFFWWQHSRAMMYDDDVYADEVHHHYYDDDGYDDEVHHVQDDRVAPAKPALDLDSVRVGAAINIHNYPESGDQTRFKASQRNRYVLKQGGAGHTWYEFKLLGPDEATWLEWEDDDGLVITQ